MTIIVHINLRLGVVIWLRAIAASLKRRVLFSIISEVPTFMFYCYNSLNNKELLRDIVEVNLCEFSKHIKNDIATLGSILDSQLS